MSFSEQFYCLPDASCLMIEQVLSPLCIRQWVIMTSNSARSRNNSCDPTLPYGIALWIYLHFLYICVQHKGFLNNNYWMVSTLVTFFCMLRTFSASKELTNVEHAWLQVEFNSFKAPSVDSCGIGNNIRLAAFDAGYREWVTERSRVIHTCFDRTLVLLK